MVVNGFTATANTSTITYAGTVSASHHVPPAAMSCPFGLYNDKSCAKYITPKAPKCLDSSFTNT